MLSNTRFFLDVLRSNVRKYSFFLISSLMLTTLVFFKPPHHTCSEITRFFWKTVQKNYKMILQKVKYGDGKNEKCDFRGWIYNFWITFWYFFWKKAKDPPKLQFWHFFCEICNFGGCFYNFFGIMIGEMGENSFIYSLKNYQKILEKCKMSFWSFKNKNWTFRGSFGNFRVIFSFFLIFLSFLIYFFL